MIMELYLQTDVKDGFERFNNDDFDLRDKEHIRRSVQMKTDLEMLLETNPAQSISELARQLGVVKLKFKKVYQYYLNKYLKVKKYSELS
ncbi:hypothetical protein WN55_04824 [Dufourea novaeangliae]|uniref:Mariner Mos1 transposase n=1 Tax=Dufourea novaeangliae TaxID=178035 RepID=A0A154P0Y0_DUFNO|nr:hypothetical protein WN55_04824 [Dufourea novaeangliae]